MSELLDALSSLSQRHSRALMWFQANAGTEIKWPKPLQDGTLVLTKAKGIYKPHWSSYALGIRESLGGPYPDQAPEFRRDGTWRYLYFQENLSALLRDGEYTNLALMRCVRDRVPVGVVRQVEPKPNPRYRVVGLGVPIQWDGGFFVIEGFSAEGKRHED